MLIATVYEDDDFDENYDELDKPSLPSLFTETFPQPPGHLAVDVSASFAIFWRRNLRAKKRRIHLKNPEPSPLHQCFISEECQKGMPDFHTSLLNELAVSFTVHGPINLNSLIIYLQAETNFDDIVLEEVSRPEVSYPSKETEKVQKVTITGNKRERSVTPPSRNRKARKKASRRKQTGFSDGGEFELNLDSLSSYCGIGNVPSFGGLYAQLNLSRACLQDTLDEEDDFGYTAI